MPLFDVIKFNGISTRDWLVYKYPKDDFVLGTQLIVNEGQMAVFVKGGQALDIFKEGTYTLNTNNIPILNSIVNIPFGNKTPFTAEIYFINKNVKLDLFWGTTDPIVLIDPKYNVRMRVRAFGQFGIKVIDYRLFLTQLIGAMGNYEVVKFDSVMKYFKGVLVTKVKTLISDIIINEKVSVLEVTPKLDEISESCHLKLEKEFDKFGLEIINFYINSINFPDEDFDRINKFLEEKASFDIIGDSRYNVKRSFDVMEASANNESNGNLAAAGIGLGLGISSSAAIGHNFSNSVSNLITTKPSVKNCTNCNSESPIESKFCMSCGNKFVDLNLLCYNCNTNVLSNSKFCPNCGVSLNNSICSKCGNENIPGSKFCNSCGNILEV